MSWWGKLVGGAFGFMIGGPLGAILGAALGHNFDRGLSGLPHDEIPDPGEKERVQTAFFTATFSVMGAVAKADGQVTSDEIRLAEAVMNEMDLNASLRKTAQRLFNEGKSPDFPLDDVIDQFRYECHRRQTLMQMFVEIQLQAAYADGQLHAAESALLKRICQRLGFSEFVFRQLEQRIRAERHFHGGGRPGAAAEKLSLKDAYALLNLAESATDVEVKKAYRRLISQHHPDKLVAKGLPEEMMKVASQKTHEIKQAYERIKSHRGMK
ncbi:MAG: co-chaperone DjlA [Chromatiales bacterium]|jgi:DnaJ like chaperone protein